MPSLLARQPAALAAIVAAIALCTLTAIGQQPTLSTRSAPILTVDGLRFRDLNHNGQLDPYEDWRLSPEARAKDLTTRMTLEEKAGLMMHGTIVMTPGRDTGYDHAAMEKMILAGNINSFISRLGGDPAHLAEEDNFLQALAERTRLGIPATISTDPRNHFQYTQGASVDRGGFSQWPETLGLAALHDPAAIRHFGDIARREYLAVGINEALSPQADLATEPRWPRINGTFGEDAALARESVQAYIEGFQDGATGIHPGSVIAVVKHWAGYGAQVNGLDSHNYYGRFAAYPGHNFPYHLIPYEGAFAAHVGAVMPTYSILTGISIDGQPIEPVGANYSRLLLTNLLRDKYKFTGVILTDWGVTQDCLKNCTDGTPPGVPPTWTGFGTDWGVADLAKDERFAKAILAGVDQFGGTEESEHVLNSVRNGKVTEARINESVARILTEKFAQGLFENPYVDPDEAKRVVGNASFQADADAAQRHSLVLLQNKHHFLPVAPGKRVYLYHVDAKAAEAAGLTVVDAPEKADFALIRVNAPFQTLHPGYAMGSHQHEGDLDFKPESADYQAIAAAASKVPTVVTIYLDRPAILTNLIDKTTAILGNFGVSDAALIAVVTGKDKPMGRLPFELPSSMADVLAQKGDVPHDTAHPLFPYAFGLNY